MFALKFIICVFLQVVRSLTGAQFCLHDRVYVSGGRSVLRIIETGLIPRT